MQPWVKWLVSRNLKFIVYLVWLLALPLYWLVYLKQSMEDAISDIISIKDIKKEDL